MKIETLTNFGHSYQSKIISALISDYKFLQQIEDILLPENFESDAHKWLIQKIKNYYIEYKSNITLDVLKVEVEKEQDEILRIEIVKKLRDAWDIRMSSDISYIKQDFLNFCINQNFKAAIYHSVEDLENQNYDSIKRRFDEALRAGQPRDYGLNFVEQDVDVAFEKLKRNTVPTPWPVINDVMDGGLAAGELGIIMGNKGSGKSWLLAALGLHALKQGQNVVYYSLELTEIMLLRRFYSLLTGLPVSELPYRKDEIKSELKPLLDTHNRLFIKEYPTKGASIRTITAHSERLILSGVKLGLSLVDYGDIMRAPTFYKDKRLQIGNIFEDLRGYAGELQIPTWTPTQGNRSTESSEVIQGDQISEDYSKLFIADFVMSWSRLNNDKLSKTARTFIVKNRFGPEALLFPALFDASCGMSEMYDPTSPKGKQQNEKMLKNKDNDRKVLSDLYKKINKPN